MICYWSHLNCFNIVFSQNRYFKKRRNIPVILEGAQSPFLPDEVVEGVVDLHELRACLDLVSRYHQQGGQINTSILIRLDLKTLAIPVDGLDLNQSLLICKTLMEYTF